MTPLERYLSSLMITQGRRAGELFKLLPWQRRFVAGAFADGVQSAALSVARGNGKTSFLSGVACAALDGPLAVPRGETIIVASSFSQARIAFDHVKAFLSDKLADRQLWRQSDSMQVAMIENRTTGARLKVIGSDPKRAHGLAPVLVLADEPSQWPSSTGERMVAALRTSAGKQPIAGLLRWVRGQLKPNIGLQKCWPVPPTMHNVTPPRAMTPNFKGAPGSKQILHCISFQI